MRSPFSALRAVVCLLSLFLLPAVSTCARHDLNAAMAPAFAPRSETADRLLVRVLVPSLERTFRAVDDLHSRNALPFASSDLRTTLLARLRIPAAVFDHVNTAKPIALAVVVPRAGAGAQTAVVAGALELKVPEAAAALSAALGQPIETQKGAQAFRRSDGGTLWVVRVGDALAWADTFEALAQAGAHAVETRREVADDVLVSAYPAAYARAEGADLSQGYQALKAKELANYDERYRALGRATPPAAERATVSALLDFILRPAPDTDVVESSLALTPEQGVHLAVKAQPRSGSTFATRTATRTPYTIDGAHLGGANVAFAAGWGESPALLQLLLDVLEAQGQAGVKGAATLATRLRSLLPLLSGAATQTLTPAQGMMASDLVFALRSGAAPAATLDALGLLASDPALPQVLRHLTGGDSPTVNASRTVDQVRTTIAFPDDNRAGSPAAIVHALFGSNSVTIVAAVKAGHLILATDPGAAARLSAYGGGTPAASIANPTLQNALDDSRGGEGFVYLDAWGVARPLLPAFLRGPMAQLLNGIFAIPGLASINLPVWLGITGGDRLTIDLRIPTSTLSNAASALSLLGGASGGSSGLFP